MSFGVLEGTKQRCHPVEIAKTLGNDFLRAAALSEDLVAIEEPAWCGMAVGGQPVERLRQFLRQLSPKARALLIAELERALLSGADVPGGDLVLQEVRRAVRESGEQPPRIGNPARLFFRSIEPFLVDGAPAHKHQGRIARASLEPIWAWIGRDLLPTEATTFADEISAALIADNAAACEQLICAFQDQVADHIQRALAAAQEDEKARRRLAGQLGTLKTLEDVRDLVEILEARDALALIGDRLPGHIRDLADAHLDGAKALLDSPAVQRGGILPYALIVVMSRLAAPWQLIRLAIKAAQTDDVARVAATPYARAVEIVLTEIERMVVELKVDLKRGGNVSVTSLLKCIHDAARGLRTELDLAADTPWSRQLAAIRAEISGMLKREIESAPGRMRRLLRPRPASEIASGAVLDSGDVADTEALIELVSACRNYAGELAISEMTTRCYNELEQYLDTGTRTLLDGLRGAGSGDRPFRQSQVDAAVRFCAKVFGQEYASLLAKAAEVAAHRERKAAVRE
jgi:hypothetical protein